MGGDIGQFAADGSIQIVDRKKNLIKLKGGEYIAVENMEMVYGNNRFVDAVSGGICCYGDGDMDRPVALMQLNKVVVMNWAKENGMTGDFDHVKDSKELYDVVMKEMDAEHKTNGLSRNEKLITVAFVADDPGLLKMDVSLQPTSSKDVLWSKGMLSSLKLLVKRAFSKRDGG